MLGIFMEIIYNKNYHIFITLVLGNYQWLRITKTKKLVISMV